MRKLLLAAALALLPSLAQAQSGPAWGRAASEATGTIATTGTYQQVLAAVSSPSARSNCLIQNTGTHTMLVFFGPSKPANSAGVGFPLSGGTGGPPAAGGGWISCGNLGGGLTSGPVWIEGPSGDTFEYTSQP